ncbi:uncharacterized protein LDX57_012196 [Aspergillus melleus]|uniref:uncharacterized protein n=1 Tax=Aspergillus melleus TaxID=138277 RepID=UPI001E8D09D7|nr:uncharacterized protein LDX57_012196 [Aspergillus melleus]KAH8434553.1 hypothetical protein LDX57_012196 [Aspergillus melleus]
MSNATTTTTTSLSHTDAAQWNRELMLEFQAALEKDPAADLISMFPDSYIQEHRHARDSRAIPKSKREREKEAEQRPGPEFRTRLELAETATIVHPLSEKVIPLLAQYSTQEDGSIGDEKTLVSALTKLIWESPKLWESPIRGVVVKCSEDIIAKIVAGYGDYTEYTSMQYLMKQAPDIPAPRPHGLIAFGPSRVIFMTYVFDKTLAQAWNSLSHENKVSIQHQLDGIFRRLRTIRQSDGAPLGGVGGEGLHELRVDECASFKGITTAKEYNDLQFSARHYGSSTYVSLLRSLLEHDASILEHGSVFTHGDIRTANIMVKQDPSSKDQWYVVSGVIDWEDSGFYPLYYECTVLSRTLSLVDENDWYLYLPESVSPLKYPVWWLIDRLWGIHLRTV